MSAIEIDGSFGEGGGQILRTSLSLSAITGRPMHIVKVRAGRARPGLLRQHLTAFRAMAEICGAQVEGAELGSREVRFTPGKPRAGEYRFAIGTAGSACLVLETVLWPLLSCDDASEVTLEGGSHNPHAPPFDFLEHTFFPVMRRMGAKIEARLERHGFYPAGGGRIVVRIEPSTLEPLELIDAGRVTARRARVLISRLPQHIAERELREVKSALDLNDRECSIETIAGDGPGNALVLHLERDALTETITAFGERGVPAERVAAAAVREARRYLAADVPVGEHLADQLIVPLALAGGAFSTLPLTLHSTTNIEVVRRFLDVDIAVRQRGANVTVEHGR